MWLQFFMALPVFFLFVYVPGYLLSRSLTSDPMVALAMAPLVVTCCYSILTIAYSALGIYTSWLTLVAPLTIAGAICFALARRDRDTVSLSRLRSDPATRKEVLDQIKSYLPYIVFAAGLGLVYFIKPLDGPESFTWRTDNTQHINLITRFIATGDWSMLHTTVYEDPTRAAIVGAGFYPAGWHVLASLVSSAFGASAAFGINVIDAVLIMVTIPTSGYLLLRTIFDDKPLAVRMGAIFPLALGVYPWRILIPEAKGSFFFGLALVPVCIAVMVLACERALDSKEKGLDKQALAYDIALALIGLLACAFAHPVCVFTLGVLMVPYFVYAIFRAVTDEQDLRSSRRKAALWIGAFLAFVVAVWVFCFNVPVIHEMTLWMHWAYTTRRAALVRVIFLGFKHVPPQPLLALFVWTGVIYSLYKKRYLWISCGFLTFSLFYIVDATTDHVIKRYLTGFWYTDFDRLAASACVIAVPLAALGFYALIRLAQSMFAQAVAQHDEDARRFKQILIPLLGAIIAAGVIYYPSYHLPHVETKTTTAFGYLASKYRTYNSSKKSILSEDERKFLKKVEKVTGDDLVLNFPADGSAFAWATNGINIYVRRYNYVYMSEAAKLLAAHLDDVSTNKEVQDALDELDAHYVLLLDMDEDGEEATIYEDGYRVNGWKGFTEINDKTPGLEVVLSEGDMRLYRIEDQAA